MKRRINFIAIHCSDSDIPEHDDIEVIRQWHIARNFSDVGYHFVIKKNGEVQLGRGENVPGAHISGHNSMSIGICLTGRHQFTAKQFFSLDNLCQSLCEKYNLTKDDILPHNYFNPGKTCPNFDLESIKRSWSWGQNRMI